MLEKSVDFDNFKIYIKVVRDSIDNTDLWKHFYSAQPHSVYSSDGLLRLPFNDQMRPAVRNTQLTYSETANILFIFRPHELASYLLSLPRANKYLLSTSLSIYGRLPLNTALASVASYKDMHFGLTDGIWESERSRDVSVEQILIEDIHLLNNKQDLNPDSVFNEDSEPTIKNLCLQYLTIESKEYFNSYETQTSGPIEILENLEKVNFDYSKMPKKPVHNHTKSQPIVKSFNALPDILNGLDIITCLNAHTSQRLQTVIDENKTSLMIYFLFAVVQKNILDNRSLRDTCAFLSSHDVVSISDSLMLILHAISKKESSEFLKAIDLIFFTKTCASPVLLPLLTSQNLSFIFNTRLRDIYDGGSTVLEFDDEFYRFKLKTTGKNYSEIFNCIQAFPLRDPISISLLHEREVVHLMRSESTDLYNELRLLERKELLKVSFIDESRIADSKQRIHQSRHTALPKKSYQCWPVYISRKISLVMMINLISVPTFLEIEKSAVVKALYSLSTKETEAEKDHETLEENRTDSLRIPGSSQPSNKRMTIRPTPPRISMLENFRAEMKKRYSSKNRFSMVRAVEIRQSFKAGGAGVMGLPTVVQNKGQTSDSLSVKKKSSRLDPASTIIRKSSISNKQSSRFSLAMTGATRGQIINPLFPHELSKLDLKDLRDEQAKTAALKMNKLYFSQAWHELTTLSNLIAVLRMLTCQKFEVHSGETSPMFGESEQKIIIEELAMSLGTTPLRWDEAVLRRVFNNTIPEELARFVPFHLPSHRMESSFATFWDQLISRVDYIQELVDRADACPKTGSYDLSRLFHPASLLLNFATLHSLKTKVASTDSRLDSNASLFTACSFQTSKSERSRLPRCESTDSNWSRQDWTTTACSPPAATWSSRVHFLRSCFSRSPLRSLQRSRRLRSLRRR